MKRFVFALLCAFSLFLPVLSQGQFAVFFGQNVVSGIAPPAQMTDVFRVFDSSTTCNGGLVCAGVSGVSDHIDTITNRVNSSNPATQSQNGNRPIWTASAFNSLAGSNLIAGGTARMDYTPATYTNGVVMVAYAHQIPSGTASDVMFGGGTQNGALEFRTNTQQIQLLNQNNAVIGAGVNTYVVGSWHTFAATWNDSTGAWAIYDCKAGTCTLDASGTTATHLSGNNSQLGAATAALEYGQGVTLEWQIGNGTTSIAGIAAYSLRQFGI